MLFAAHYPILRSRTFWNWCLSRLEAENELYRLSRMERERETEWGWIHHKGVTCILYSAIVSSRGRTWQIVCHLLAIVIACHLPKATRTPRCSSRLCPKCFCFAWLYMHFWCLNGQVRLYFQDLYRKQRSRQAPRTPFTSASYWQTYSVQLLEHSMSFVYTVMPTFYVQLSLSFIFQDGLDALFLF